MYFLKFSILIPLMVMAIGLETKAAGAGTEGHGGGAMVCRDAQGHITSAELMDFFEGREVYKPQLTINIDNTPGTRAAQAKAALARLAGYGFKLDEVLKAERVLPSGLGLTQIFDSKHPAVKRGCQYEQLANYTDDGEILIDGEIYPFLSETDKAGLDVHETVYLFLREWEGPEQIPAVEDSRYARRVTATAFSTSPIHPAADVPADAWMCFTDNEYSDSALETKNYGPKKPAEFPKIYWLIFDSGKTNEAGWKLLTVAIFGYEGRPQFGQETFEMPEYMFSNSKDWRANDGSYRSELKVRTVSEVDAGQDLLIATTARKLKDVMFEVFVPKLRKSTLLRCQPGPRLPKGQKPSLDPDKITFRK